MKNAFLFIILSVLRSNVSAGFFANKKIYDRAFLIAAWRDSVPVAESFYAVRVRSFLKRFEGNGYAIRHENPGEQGEETKIGISNQIQDS